MTYSSPDRMTPDTLQRPQESEQTEGRTLTSLANFLGWIDYQIFLAVGLYSGAQKRQQEAQLL